MTAPSEARLLDLAACRPDEYEGCLVVINGARYRIGPFAGQGAEKIVHPLTNVVSGLTLHVIKVFRDQELIKSSAARLVGRLAKLRRYFGSAIPNYLIEQSHNGWFEVQDVVPGLLPATEISAADEACSAGSEAAQSGLADKALAHYEAALQLNPFHTHAIVGAAHMHAQLGHAAKAIAMHETALRIEPNCCGYYLSLAVLAYEVGLPRETIECYEAMKRHFPYQEEIDEVVAAALLACGQPEEAVALLDDSTRHDLDETAVAEIRSRAAELQDARQRAASAWQRGSEAAVVSDAEATSAALYEALSVNPTDPWLLVNVALHRVRLDQPGASAMLYSALRYVPAQFALPCRVSLAYYAQLSDPRSERARNLIRDLGRDLTTADGELFESASPVPAALWLDLDGVQCVDPAGVLVPAARMAFEATGDPRFDAVARLYAG